MNYLDKADTSVSLVVAYEQWKSELLNEHLPGNSSNPYGDKTNWFEVFETGKR